MPERTSGRRARAFAAAVIFGGFAPVVAAQAPLTPVSRDSLTSDGRTRTLAYYVPPSARPGAPLVIAFHGAGGSGARLRGFTGGVLERLADRNSFIVVYPDGVGGSWNDCRAGAPYEAKRANVDDVEFARAVVDHFAELHAIDRSRVVALGYSNGAHLAFRLALEAPELVRGIAAFGANLPADSALDCRPVGQPVPTVVVNGTADRINPYGGGLVVAPTGDTIGVVRPALATAAYFATLDGTSEVPEISTVFAPDDSGLSVERARFGDAAVLYTIVGGGHAIPGSRSRFPALVGRTEHRLEALEASLEFLLWRRGVRNGAVVASPEPVTR